MCAWGVGGGSQGVPGEGSPESLGEGPGPKLQGSITLVDPLVDCSKPFKNVRGGSQGRTDTTKSSPGGVFGWSWWGLGGVLGWSWEVWGGGEGAADCAERPSSAATRRVGACQDGFRNLLRILVRILRTQRV